MHYDFIYQDHCSQNNMFNSYISQNDGLSEDDYDPETGEPNYYKDLKTNLDISDFQSICDPRFLHIFPDASSIMTNFPEPNIDADCHPNPNGH